jgi:hypothetical protein
MNKSYSDYIEFCNKEGYNGFSKKMFELRLKSLGNKNSTAKDKKHFEF